MPKEKSPSLPHEGIFAVESFKSAGLTPLTARETKEFLARAGEPSETREKFNEIIERERTKLRDFFGADMEVPPIPAEVTQEKYEKWKEMKLELHYIPAADMTEDKQYPGWKKKPTSNINLFTATKDAQNKLALDTLKLNAAWVLVDTRDKPAYNDGEQEYPEDTKMGAVLADLRTAGTVSNFKKKDSRFNISWEELHQEDFKKKLAVLFDVKPEAVRLPHAIEGSFLGNLHHPSWGDTNSWEWYEDSYQGSTHLLGGYSASGGLSGVSWYDAGGRDVSLGFRPLIVFS